MVGLYVEVRKVDLVYHVAFAVVHAAVHAVDVVD